MLKPLSGLLNLALPTALRENDTGPEAGGMPFADVFASLDQEAPDTAEPDEGEETSEMSVDEPKLSPSDGQQQTSEMADIDRRLNALQVGLLLSAAPAPPGPSRSTLSPPPAAFF